jgi:hypothetical protein
VAVETEAVFEFLSRCGVKGERKRDKEGRHCSDQNRQTILNTHNT